MLPGTNPGLYIGDIPFIQSIRRVCLLLGFKSAFQICTILLTLPQSIHVWVFKKTEAERV